MRWAVSTGSEGPYVTYVERMSPTRPCNVRGHSKQKLWSIPKHEVYRKSHLLTSIVLIESCRRQRHRWRSGKWHLQSSCCWLHSWGHVRLKRMQIPLRHGSATIWIAHRSSLLTKVSTMKQDSTHQVLLLALLRRQIT